MQASSIYDTIYLENHETFPDRPVFLTQLQENANRFFQLQGFPGKKDEQYKYTYLEPGFQSAFPIHSFPSDIKLDIQSIFRCDVPELDTHTIFTVNGFYYDSQEPLKSLENGILIGSLKAAIKQYPTLVEKHLGKYSNTKDSYAALNTMLFLDGVFIYVPKGKVLQKPIQIIQVLCADNPLMAQPRNLFILEAQSEANVIVCDHSLSPSSFLTNSVTEVFTGESAHFDYFNLQNEHNQSTHVSHTFIHQQNDSHVQTNIVTLHGGLVRNNLHIQMNGEGCTNNALGLFLTDKTQHVDNSVYVHHALPHCESKQLYKCILEEQSTGAFSGKILVDKNAQKTIAYQKNSSILLSDDAKMNSKPQLEIYADDVKCGHGGTIGQLDEEALFYMRSRGISLSEARLMLMFAFAHEVLREIKNEPLLLRMTELLDKRLRKELSPCNNCSVNCG